jgi:hypothetical protein
MTAISPAAHTTSNLGLIERPVSATAWHPWFVIIPRRTITGRLVRGRVWRRHDGRHWLYKKYVVRAERDAQAKPTCRASWSPTPVTESARWPS